MAKLDWLDRLGERMRPRQEPPVVKLQVEEEEEEEPWWVAEADRRGVVETTTTTTVVEEKSQGEKDFLLWVLGEAGSLCMFLIHRSLMGVVGTVLIISIVSSGALLARPSEYGYLPGAVSFFVCGASFLTFHLLELWEPRL